MRESVVRKELPTPPGFRLEMAEEIHKDDINYVKMNKISGKHFTFIFGNSTYICNLLVKGTFQFELIGQK